MHEPVLLHSVIDCLAPRAGELVIDGTVDGGGHAAAIIPKLMPGGTFLGVDWDKNLYEACRKKFAHERGAIFAHDNYADLPQVLAEKQLPKADGLLIDLGFSSEQLAASGRGFSFTAEAANEPLLMTYDDSREPVSALLRTLSEEALANIIFEYGGERRSRQIAKAIKDAGRRKAITTSGELADIIRGALPKSYERGRIDPATRTFQALRIYANDELGNLQTLLSNLQQIVGPGGRVAIISFHSIEDGMVKRAFRDMAKAGTLELINKKPIEATREEIKANPRSRSAKLRGARMI